MPRRKNCSDGYSCKGSCISRERSCIGQLEPKEAALVKLLGVKIKKKPGGGTKTISGSGGNPRPSTEKKPNPQMREKEIQRETDARQNRKNPT